MLIYLKCPLAGKGDKMGEIFKGNARKNNSIQIHFVKKIVGNLRHFPTG